MASERSPSTLTLTLHRSEVVAQTVALLDHKGVSAASRARGRGEGFSSKPSLPYRPLGAPVPYERIAEINQARVTKVEKIQKAVCREAGTQPNGTKPKRREQGLGVDIAEAKDLEAKSDAEVHDDNSEATRQVKLQDLPHGLWGKELPRCEQSRRKEKDGFMTLQDYVKESSNRLCQVKTGMFVPDVLQTAGKVRAIEDRTRAAIFDDRLQLGAQSKSNSGTGSSPAETSNALHVQRTSSGAPMSAREKLQAKPQLQLSGSQTARRPSNAGALVMMNRSTVPQDSAASGSSAVVERSDREKVDPGLKRLRGQINELLPTPVLTGLTGNVAKIYEDACGKKGKKDVYQLLEIKLNDRIERIEPGTDINAYWKSYLAQAVQGALPAPKESSGASPQKGRGREVVAADEMQPKDLVASYQAPTADQVAYRHQQMVTQKAISQLNEPEALVSPVAKLRKALNTYQDARKSHREKLQERLTAMDSHRTAQYQKEVFSKGS